MSTKLYPPYLEGTIPAFYTTVDPNTKEETTIMKVPFSMNRAVGENVVGGFILKIKSVQSNSVLGTIKLTVENLVNKGLINKEVEFDVSNIQFIVGNSYKIQMAYLSKEGYSIGYYSNVGVIKYTIKPTILIEDLDSDINRHIYDYLGKYSQEITYLKCQPKDSKEFSQDVYYTYDSEKSEYKRASSYSVDTIYYKTFRDASEKMYSSRFILTNSKNQIVYDSGEILHNASADIEVYTSYEQCTISQDLDDGEAFYLQYFVTTTSNMSCASKKYRLMQFDAIEADLHGKLTAKMNFNEGYIDLLLEGDKDANGLEFPQTGRFIISRAASNENFAWHKIGTFSLQAELPSRVLWRDFTVEQGITYRYSLQQFNDYKLYSDRILSNDVIADFEDAFLYDGERQLKLRFNPKVSTFKLDVMETKTDTIGSKYPFIFRNGNVQYHEFSISGLISHLQDDAELFMTNEDLGLKQKLGDLSTENIAAERKFKLEVMQWLNNGKMKLFRTPSEGNYIVRLMNVSLSPNDTVSRMLHTFSATAYQMDEFNYDRLINNHFITITRSDYAKKHFQTVALASHSAELDDLLNTLAYYIEAGVNVRFSEEMRNRVLNGLSGTSKTTIASYFIRNTKDVTSYLLNVNALKNDKKSYSDIMDIVGKITYVTGQINRYPIYDIRVENLPGTRIQLDSETIYIGNSGHYEISFSEPINSLIIPDPQTAQTETGTITFTYYTDFSNVFEKFESVSLKDVPDQIWIGAQTRTAIDRTTGRLKTTSNLIEIIEDVKTQIANIFSLKFTKRSIIPIYYNEKDKKYYFDMDCSKDQLVNKYDPYIMYAICNRRKDYTYDVIYNEGFFITAYAYQGYYVSNNGSLKTKIFTGNYLDGKTKAIIPEKEYSIIASIDGDEFLVENGIEINMDLYGHKKLKSITFGNGLICEMSYRKAILTYSFERDSKLQPMNQYRTVYENYVERLEKLIKEADTSLNGVNPSVELPKFEKDRETIINTIKTNYNLLVDSLATYLYQYEEAL